MGITTQFKCTMQHFDQLDVYTDGDPDFKNVLMKLIIENLEELQSALSESIQQNDPRSFTRACHKAKSTFAMLNIDGLSITAEELIKTIQAQDKAHLFMKLCKDLIRDLEDKIKSGESDNPG